MTYEDNKMYEFVLSMQITYYVHICIVQVNVQSWCEKVQVATVDQENFHVKIILRSRSTAKIKHANNKITRR